jgi:hypothetical protein
MRFHLKYRAQPSAAHTFSLCGLQVGPAGPLSLLLTSPSSSPDWSQRGDRPSRAPARALSPPAISGHEESSGRTGEMHRFHLRWARTPRGPGSQWVGRSRRGQRGIPARLVGATGGPRRSSGYWGVQEDDTHPPGPSILADELGTEPDMSGGGRRPRANVGTHP